MSNRVTTILRFDDEQTRALFMQFLETMITQHIYRSKQNYYFHMYGIEYSNDDTEYVIMKKEKEIDE